jgi:hypothetical protein
MVETNEGTLDQNLVFEELFIDNKAASGHTFDGIIEASFFCHVLHFGHLELALSVPFLEVIGYLFDLFSASSRFVAVWRSFERTHAAFSLLVARAVPRTSITRLSNKVLRVF